MKPRGIYKLPQRLLGWILLALLFIYKYVISPVLHALSPGSGCRFVPSCSEYAIEAVKTHGPFRGGWLAVRRLSKCHPWGSHGYDPVPHTCSCTDSTDHQHSSPLTRKEAPNASHSGH